MRKLNLLLMLAATIGITSSCQKEGPSITLDETLKALGANVEEPYRFSFRSTFLTPIPEDGGDLVLGMTGTHLTNYNWEDCGFVEITIGSNPFRTYFQKTKSGMAHVLYEPSSGEDPEWSCQAMATPHPKQMGPVNIFPYGGWNYCAQALTLIETFGAGSVSFIGQIAIFEWENVSRETGAEMLDHYAGAGWGENTEVSSVTLKVNGEIGAPIFFRLDLANGESMETTFEDYEHTNGGYSAGVEELRERLNVSPEVKCWCEGKIYEVTLPFEGGENR